MMPLERSGAFTLACMAVLLIVAAAMAFLSYWRSKINQNKKARRIVHALA